MRSLKRGAVVVTTLLVVTSIAVGGFGFGGEDGPSTTGSGSENAVPDSVSSQTQAESNLTVELHPDPSERSLEPGGTYLIRAVTTAETGRELNGTAAPNRTLSVTLESDNAELLNASGSAGYAVESLSDESVQVSDTGGSPSGPTRAVSVWLRVSESAGQNQSVSLVTTTDGPNATGEAEFEFELAVDGPRSSFESLAEAAEARADIARRYHAVRVALGSDRAAIDEDTVRAMREHFATVETELTNAMVLSGSSETGLVSNGSVDRRLPAEDVLSVYGLGAENRSNATAGQTLRLMEATASGEVSTLDSSANASANASVPLLRFARLAENESEAWRNGDRDEAVGLLYEQQVVLSGGSNVTDSVGATDELRRAYRQYAANRSAANDSVGTVSDTPWLSHEASAERPLNDAGTPGDRLFESLRQYAAAETALISQYVLPVARYPEPSVRTDRRPERIAEAFEDDAVGDRTTVRFVVSNGEYAGVTSPLANLSVSHSQSVAIVNVTEISGDARAPTVARTETGEPVVTATGDRQSAENPLLDIYESYEQGEQNTYEVTFERRSEDDIWITYRGAFRPLIDSGDRSVVVRTPVVSDERDQRGWSVETIRTGNVPPSVAISGPSRATVGQEFTLAAAGVSDPDDPASELTYDWTVRSAPAGVDIDLPNGTAGTVTLPQPGEYEFSLVVSDPDGGTAETPTTITAVDTETDQPPNASFELSPSDFTVGYPTTLDASPSSDPGGSIVSYEWDFDGDDQPDATGAVVNRTFNSTDNRTVQLRVTDGDGRTDATTRTISPVQTHVEYVNCTAARLYGDFERVEANGDSNVADGIDTTFGVRDREELTEQPDGSIVVRYSDLWGDYSINGTVLAIVSLFGEDGRVAETSADRQLDGCYRNVRPRVDATVDDVTRTGPGTYDVTFRYRNDHDLALSVTPELRGGVAATGDRVPPRSLEPGEHTVSVEWTPTNETERLTWEVGFYPGWAGYDEPFTVQTEPASEYGFEEPEETTVELINCSAARITGDFERVQVLGRNNAPDGVDTFIEEPTREDLIEQSDGSVVLRVTEIPPYGINGSIIDEITAYDQNRTELDSASVRELPDDCDRQVRPRVSASLVDVTQTSSGTYNVTFRYENDHNTALSVGPSLQGEGNESDDRVPPAPLEPGEHTFSVEWTPASNDERLTWDVGFEPENWVGIEEPITVETRSAAEYGFEEPDETGVAFVNCTAARVTGPFDYVSVNADFNAPDGFATLYRPEIDRADLPERSDGSVIVDSSQIWPDEGINGTALATVTVYAENGTEVSRVEYDSQRERCHRQIRPELNVSLADVTETGAGTYAVTFEYENGHDTELSVAPELRGQTNETSDRIPPGSLEPGEQTFTVEWTPASDDERLTWEAGVYPSFAGYEEPLTARTNRASEYGFNQSTETSVEFVNCTAARVTGDFDRVQVNGDFNAPDGYATLIAERSRDELPEQSDGSVVVDSTDIWPDEGITGTILATVTVYDEDGSEVASANYDAQQDRCQRQLRPRVNASLVDVTQTGQGAYNVTFRYDSDHDSELSVDPELLGQVSATGDDVPPTTLEPGEQTFTVEWTPASDDERLTWEVGFYPAFAGYDEPVTVQTDPASEYGSEPSQTTTAPQNTSTTTPTPTPAPTATSTPTPTSTSTSTPPSTPTPTAAPTPTPTPTSTPTAPPTPTPTVTPEPEPDPTPTPSPEGRLIHVLAPTATQKLDRKRTRAERS